MLTTSLLLIFVDQFILPAILMLWLVKRRYKRQLDWIFHVLFTAFFIAFIVTTGRWDLVGYYLRYAWVVVFIAAAYFSGKTAWHLPFFVKYRFREGLLLLFIMVLTGIYGANNHTVLRGLGYTEIPVDLVFPMNSGTYYVAHGGNCLFLNHHQSYRPQRYAVDIVKLNRFGLRARGLYPKNNDKYEIYGDVIYSPCDGRVIKAVDNQPDMIPVEMNKKRPLGNYVAIRTAGVEVYLAHMMKGSLLVKQGDFVRAGLAIGKVGNSGKSSQPHLHIHAESNSRSVPMTFSGRFLVRNDLF